MTIEHETIRAYFEEKLRYYIDEISGLQAQDILDNLVVANESIDKKDRKRVSVILKFLPATNTNGVVDIPIQLLVDVQTDYLDEVFNALQTLAYDLNQTIDGKKIANNPVEYEYKFKQFYRTPFVLQTFENGGAYKYTMVSMDVRFVVFTSIAVASDMKLSLTCTIGSPGDEDTDTYDEDSDEILELNTALLNTVFHLENRFDGRVFQNQPKQRNSRNSYNLSLSLSYIRNIEDTLQNIFFTQCDTNARWVIKYKMGNYYKQFKASIQTYTDTVLVSDVVKTTVEFVSVGGD